LDREAEASSMGAAQREVSILAGLTK